MFWNCKTQLMGSKDINIKFGFTEENIGNCGRKRTVQDMHHNPYMKSPICYSMSG